MTSVQPYIAAVGHSYKEIVNYVVVVDEVRWEFTSPLKAFQVLFQIYHVLFGEYCFDSKHIMYVIQRNLFKLTTVNDKFGSDVRVKLGQLEETEKLNARENNANQ